MASIPQNNIQNDEGDLMKDQLFHFVMSLIYSFTKISLLLWKELPFARKNLF